MNGLSELGQIGRGMGLVDPISAVGTVGGGILQYLVGEQQAETKRELLRAAEKQARQEAARAQLEAQIEAERAVFEAGQAARNQQVVALGLIGVAAVGIAGIIIWRATRGK